MKRWIGLMQLSVITALLVLILYLFIGPHSTLFQSKAHNLKVTFLDVGQGDATLIESPSGTQVLIDGGPGSGVLRALSRELGFFDRDIDMIVATHPDQDHIGGLIDVLLRYDVDTVLLTENESDTPVFDSFEERVKEEGATIRYARRGQVYDLGSGAVGSTTLTILFPDRDPSGLESNASSIVARLVYGETEFMFTGDSPQAIEEYLVEIDGNRLGSDVLKAGHHGSRTSSAHTFLEMTHPAYAIISAGKDNKYGHPHKEVIEAFNTFGIITKNTALVGSISFESDGAKVWSR